MKCKDSLIFYCANIYFHQLYHRKCRALKARFTYIGTTEIFRKTVSDVELLQRCIIKTFEWFDKCCCFFLRSHPDKSKTMTISNKKLGEMLYKLRPELPFIQRSSAEKDIVVIIDDQL